jgi:hypothetical protein
MSNLGGNLMRKFNLAIQALLAAIVCLLVTAFAGAQTTVTPASVNFGNAIVNTTSPLMSVVVKNTGAASISISSVSVSVGTPYAISNTSTCLNPTLAAGASCTVYLSLSPTTLGAQPAGTLTLTTTAPNSPQTVALSGTGVGATSLTTPTLHFNNVVVGNTSAILTDTLYNNQSSAVAITSLIPSGVGIAVNSSTTCGTSLPGYSSCKIAMTFTPSAVGAVTGSVTVNTSAANSPLTISLSGTGIAAVGLTPSSLNFGNQVLGVASAAQVLTLNNNQASALSISQVLFGGPFVLDTGVATTCPLVGGTVSGTLAAGASCAIGIDFSPTSLGATSGGQITVIDSAASSPQIALLAGTGIVPVRVSPTGIAFGNELLNTTSAAQTVTVTNKQAVSLNFASISAPAPYAVVSGSTTCRVGTPLMAGSSCVINLTYSPTLAGATPASALTLADDAYTSPQSVNLTGTGVTPVTLNPSALYFGTVSLNTAVVRSLTLTNNQSVPLSISSITGLPAAYSLNSAGTTCKLVPSTLAAGSSCVIAVSLSATTYGAQPGTISVNDDAPNTPQTFTLNANAIPSLAVSPSSLSFTGQPVGVISAPQTITLTNQQSTPLSITSATFTGNNGGDFSVLATTCPYSPATLAVGGHCTLQVAFTPTGSGTRTAALNINDPLLIPLIGLGNAPVTVLPGLLSYSMPVGSTSPFKTVTITNASSSTALHISNLQLSGDFIQTSTDCGTMPPYTLAPGTACHVALTFDPSVGGVRDGQLQVYDDAVTSPQVVNLTGNGTFPLTIQPSPISFSGQMVGTVSAAKIAILTNHETKSETFTLVASGDFTASSNSSNP